MWSEEQEDLAYEMSDDLHAMERKRWTEDELAYNGSAWPMRRELTPRERDILTRILDGWWHRLIELDAARRGEDPFYLTRSINLDSELLNDPSLAWMRMDVDECQLLLNLRTTLNPRQD
jgi:hypothetical protein